jgi:hypothetical protein
METKPGLAENDALKQQMLSEKEALRDVFIY